MDKYAIFGPFDLQEARALSTSDPMECTPFAWNDKTHLESVGQSCLNYGGMKYQKGHSRHSSHHFGGKFSTIIYNDVRMVLCQLDDTSGIYACEVPIDSIFLRGFDELLAQKKNPESGLNNALDKRRLELRKRVEAEPNKSHPWILKIKESGVMERSNQKLLDAVKAKREPEYFTESELKSLIEKFYDVGIFGRYTHMGMALRHLGISTAHLVKDAKEEQLFGAKQMSDTYYQFCAKYLEENTEEKLFEEI